jgi:CRISPR-associated protein Csx3
MELIHYDIGVSTPIEPGTDTLPNLPAIPPGGIVVIGGRAPIWRYCLAFHRLHGSPAGVICVFDPKVGNIVVASHKPGFEEGQVIEGQWR